MPLFEFEVWIFDPVAPFNKFSMALPVLDTWHKYTLITRSARARIPQVPDDGTESLALSGGMSIEVPCVSIGLRIGTIDFPKVKALVVDDGQHEVLLGSELINRAFTIGEHDEDRASVWSEWKDDPAALSVELYPIEAPFPLHYFESFLTQQRRLYNILLLLDGVIDVAGVEDVGSFVDHDSGIDANFRLQLSWIDSGSIWTSLKSGSVNTLRRLAHLFDASASAKLAQQVADASMAETKASILRDTRDTTARRIREEQEMLIAHNRKITHDIWRTDAKERIKFFDELLEQVDDDERHRQLSRLKDEAIAELVNTQLLPMVRNIPRAHQSPEGLSLLLASDDDAPRHG